MIARLRALKVQHRVIEARIDREHIRPSPDTVRLRMLKKLRLRLREEIDRVDKLLMSRAGAQGRGGSVQMSAQNVGSGPMGL